jgi:hypothetical protein
VVSNESVIPPSGSEPETCRPFHSEKPRVVPIHTVSPLASTTRTESDGKPSRRFITSQR